MNNDGGACFPNERKSATKTGHEVKYDRKSTAGVSWHFSCHNKLMLSRHVMQSLLIRSVDAKAFIKHIL